MNSYTVPGPLLFRGPTPALDMIYAFTLGGLSPPNSDLSCGAPGDLATFVNVAALSAFLAPYSITLKAQTSPPAFEIESPVLG